MTHWIINGLAEVCEKIGGPIAFALLAYLLGRMAYFQQKEFELIRKRYLENTLDLFAGHIEHCLSVHRMNWQQSLEVLRVFRDGGEHTPMPQLNKTPIHRVEHSNLHIATAYRLGRLLNREMSFFKLQQLLVAFVEEGAALIANDMLVTIGMVVDGKISPRKIPEIVEGYEKRLKARDEEAKAYYRLIAEVEAIVMEFEESRFTLKNLHKFAKRKEVRRAIERTRAALEEIAPDAAKEDAEQGEKAEPPPPSCATPPSPTSRAKS